MNNLRNQNDLISVCLCVCEIVIAIVTILTRWNVLSSTESFNNHMQSSFAIYNAGHICITYFTHGSKKISKLKKSNLFTRLASTLFPIFGMGAFQYFQFKKPIRKYEWRKKTGSMIDFSRRLAGLTKISHWYVFSNQFEISVEIIQHLLSKCKLTIRSEQCKCSFPIVLLLP